MKTIGIVTNRDKDAELRYTRILIDAIIQKGGKILLPYNISNELSMIGCAENEEDVYSKADMIICLGGDGTFLSTARKAFTKNKPILGINLGSLGFLTEIDKNDIGTAVDCIMKGCYNIEERMMLEVTVSSNGNTIAKESALNDIVISRGALSRILHLKTYINNSFLDAFPGDGLIISSPTGSTAYSLSAGGPIVEPGIDLMIITPICPHILYSRSFIATGDRVIKTVVDEKYDHEAMVTVDGQVGYNIKGGDIIEVKKASETVKMVRINSKNFFNILRTKIYDRGEQLKRNEI